MDARCTRVSICPIHFKKTATLIAGGSCYIWGCRKSWAGVLITIRKSKAGIALKKVE
jgi:hypothetical protein